MAVVDNHLTTSSSGVSASSYNTASISPVANKLVIATVRGLVGSGTVNTPTCSGASMTWTLVKTQISASNLTNITMFRALSASPGSGALTFDFGGQSQNSCAWSITEFTDVNTTGTNGANAVVQNNGDTNTGTQSSLTVTLNSFSSARNATHGVINKGGNNNPSAAGDGFTELGIDTNTQIIESAFKNSNDTTVAWTWSSESATAVAVAIEIAAENQGGTQPAFEI